MRPREIFSPSQCRAARGLLAWSQAELGQQSGVELETVELYEDGEGELSLEDQGAIGSAFYRAGVIAVLPKYAGEGVRFNKPDGGCPSPWTQAYSVARPGLPWGSLHEGD